MIAIRADDLEIEISGTVEELREVSFTISALVTSGQNSTTISAQATDPNPYGRALGSMFIERTTGQTVVSAKNSLLIVSGSDGSLSKFASWFEFSLDADSGDHAHFEPLSDDPDHSADSIPLVVLIR